MRQCSTLLVGFFVFVSATFLQSAPVPLINSSDLWYYHRGTNAAQADWKTAPASSLAAGQWQTGQGGFGFASDNAVETSDCRTLLYDMRNNYSVLYLRRSFTVVNPPEPGQHLMLAMDWDDGFIAWLDGNYLTNMYVAKAPLEPGITNIATANHECSKGNSSPQPAMVFDVGEALSRLGPGEHTLAIMGLNVTTNSSDFVQIATLYLDTPPEPPTNTVTGTLVADTTLYASNSPYAVVGNLTIDNNVTLTIEPGTILQMHNGASLTVADYGRLLAEGTPQAPIRFVRPPQSSADWGGLLILGADNSPENRIAHAFFDGNSASPCIQVTGGTVFFDHLSFGTTSRPYLGLDRSSFVVTDCYFPPATATFEPVHGKDGIKAGGRAIIQNCFFGAHSGYADSVDFTGGNRPGPIIQFLNNVFVGTGDDNIDLDSTDAWIEGNIFLHVHKNGSPDTSSAISGGNDDGNTSGVTVIGNFFYDCDHLALMKQGNLFTFLNNTLVRQTHIGGLDSEGALICLQDNGMTEGRGTYLEGNIFVDIERLTRDVVAGVVTFSNNLVPLTWTGPGGGNSSEDPRLAHVPQMSETYFTNWADAQIVKQWFALLPGSPGLGTGPNGTDKGAAIPRGVSISGEPTGPTTNTTATLRAGLNRRGGLLYSSDWPFGTGFTHYKWRLNQGDWSAETPIASPIVLTDLAPGPQQVEVVGRNDAGFYQDDPVFGSNAVVTVSKAWTVQAPHPDFSIQSVTAAEEGIIMTFPVQAGRTYTVQYQTVLHPSSPWLTLTNLESVASSGPFNVLDPAPSHDARFYRVTTPALP